jgi:hypothetical protein
MRKIFGFIASWLQSAVFIVGLMTIFDIAQNRQPFMYKVSAISFSIIGGCGFIWVVAIKPFLEGLKEGPSRISEPTVIASPPLATPQAPLSGL